MQPGVDSTEGGGALSFVTPPLQSAAGRADATVETDVRKNVDTHFFATRQVLLLGPDMGDRHVESVNAALKSVYESGQPGLARLTLSPLFGADPVRQLGNDYGTRVTAILFFLEPRDDLRIG